MTESPLFYDTASIDYPILDSDAHVNEPPDLWLDRVPRKWRDRAPQIADKIENQKLGADQPPPQRPPEAQP